MSNSLPKFDAPPVIETVLSVQFERLDKFSNAHGGWFWKNYLDKEWNSVRPAPRLEDQFEHFGDEIKWAPAGGGIRIITGSESDRLQIFRADDERMIQIQDSRFVYNWRKRQSDYPSYEKVLADFRQQFSQFEKFVKDAELGTLKLNQWEVTYVNHIAKGTLWNNYVDWIKIFPRVSTLAPEISDLNHEDFRGSWRVIIGDNRGRLHVTLNTGRLASEKGVEVIRLELTARGPVHLEKDLDLWKGFDVGHSAIVRYFAAVTSAEAQQIWKRRI